MLRLGDGEMKIALKEERYQKHSNSLIGRNISIDELILTQNNLKDCVLYSDILGLPTKHHINTGSLWKCLIDYYENIKNLSPNKWVEKKYCSINSHLELLSSGDIFKILSVVSKIVIVSPRDVVQKMKEKYSNLLEIEYYNIPGEQCYEENKNDDKTDFFTKINEIIDSFKSKNRKGELLIYGAGTFGKILGLEFKKEGGVVLDLGSVFDLFIGKITRGPEKGINKYTTPVL